MFTRLIKKHYLELLLFTVFVLVHLPTLGADNFNTDVWKWKSRIYDFGSGVFTLHFEKTVQKYHPGVTLLWIGTFAVKSYNLYYDVVVKHAPMDNDINTVFQLDFTQKLFMLFATTVSLLIALYPLKTMFGKRFYTLSFVLSMTEPFYLAMTRVIHLEGLMSTFMIGALVWLYKYYADSQRKKSTLVVLGIFVALSVLTKTSSLFLLPFSGLTMFMWYPRAKGFRLNALRSSLNDYWKVLVVFVVAFVLLWPAMITHPMLALTALYKGIFTVGASRGHEQFYFGKYVLDPGFTFYFVVLALKSSIYLVPFLGFFAYLVKKDKAHTSLKSFCTYMAIFGLSYIVFLTIPSKKLDRYILPSLLAFVFPISYVFIWLEDNLKGKLKFLALGPYILSILILVRIHPDYFSYFNPFFGGLKYGVYAIEPKWLIGEPEITAYLLRLKEEKGLADFTKDETLDNLLDKPLLQNRLVVGFDEKYYTQIWPFVRKLGGWAIIQDLTPYAIHAKYFIYPVWDDAGARETRFKVKKLDTIKIRGVDIYNLYERI